MNNVSTYLRNQIVNCALRGTAYTSPAHVYLALYTSDPTTEDVGTEIAGLAALHGEEFFDDRPVNDWRHQYSQLRDDAGKP